MLPNKLSFVDIETTGGRSRFDRIIEIGIIKIENDTIIETYSSLVNPATHIPPEITRLTGITDAQVTNAPYFREIAPEIIRLLDDTVFVAHNVRFDYGFLKTEFKRLNQTFSSKHFCTVRLSRALFPHLPRHNLDSIIERMHIPCINRHRALDDAQVLVNFYTKVKADFSEEIFTKAMQTVLKKPYLPVKLTEDMLESLPEQPGVYIFYGQEGIPLYIGKSINIKERVLSHFSGDIHSPLEMKIAQQVESIETIITTGELGALFLESQLIKTRLPLFNRMLRRKQELVALRRIQDQNGYESAVLETLSTPPVHTLDSFLGFFRSRKQAKDHLSTLIKEYSLCEKLLGLEKTTGNCFNYRLDKCKGACTQKEIPLAYNMRFIQAFSATRIKSWPFPGQIIIEEYNEHLETTEYFLVDKWCLLGTVTTDTQGSKKETLHDYAFDLDTYKILSRFVRNPRNTKRIKILSKQENKEQLNYQQFTV